MKCWRRRLFSIIIVGLVLLCFGCSEVSSEATSQNNVSESVKDYLTKSPSQCSLLQARPRMYVTRAMLPSLRMKLEDSIYSQDVKVIKESKNPTDQAFRFLVWGDQNAGLKAKRSLLAGEIPRWKGMERSIHIVQAALMYDWLYPLMTPGERELAIEIVKSTFPKGRKKDREGIQYYFNDHWARGSAFVTIAALSLAGDDHWATEHIEKACNESSEVFTPYGGGAIDVLNTLAIDTGGGHQAGIKNAPGTGYEAMFQLGAGLFLPAWQAATNQDVLSKTTYYETLPFYLTYAYQNVNKPGEAAKQILEYLTGFGSDRSASLAKWMLDQYGRAQYARVMRLIQGDLAKTVPMSPDQINLPKATFLSGADLVVSRTGWAESDISVFMFARHWDTSRYEPYSGLVSIYKGSKPLLVRGIKGKKPFSTVNNSGIWVWKDGENPAYGQGGTYWQNLSNFGRPTYRASSAADVLDPNKPEYRPETLTDFSVKNGVVKATTRYEKLLRYKGVELAERTLMHDDHFLMIEDHLKVPSNARVAWSLRLAEKPVIEGNTIITSDMTITLKSPAVKIRWLGGEGDELLGPTGKWLGDGKGGFVEGYSRREDKKRQYGLGTVFAEPIKRSEEYRFEAIIMIK